MCSHLHYESVADSKRQSTVGVHVESSSKPRIAVAWEPSDAKMISGAENYSMEGAGFILSVETWMKLLMTR